MQIGSFDSPSMRKADVAFRAEAQTCGSRADDSDEVDRQAHCNEQSAQGDE